MNDILTSYYEDGAKKLHNVVNNIFYRKYGGIADKDMDEFYSVANDVFTDIIINSRYDSSKGDFDGFLYGALDLAIIDEFKRQNRDKRTSKIEVEIDGKKKKVPVRDVYLDTPIGEDDNLTIGDMIQSDFDTSIESIEMIGNNYDEKVEEYLNTLPEVPRIIAKLIMEGYSAKEIKEKLKISNRQYQSSLNAMKSYEKKRILYKENNNLEDVEMNTVVLVEDVAETFKNTSYSIESISKQLQKKRIRDDHILQRHSGQWKSFAKSELISDILRGKSLTQIIISEEIKNGLRMQWLIDGKQRCSTLDDFLHDGFAITRNVKNYNVRYQTTKVDKDGNEVLNEDGFTEMEFREFDIRGKRFSQLPEELQDIFKDRQIPVLYNMNCTKKDIADDIARFNRSRPMNKSQNGWLGMDESFGEFVDNIAKMQFFQSSFSGSTYTDNNHTSGLIRRIIVESIMVSDFVDEYNKDFNKMCEFLSEEASDSNFTEFYSLVERLMLVSTKEVGHMFNSKDSFLWFGLFSRFSKLETKDQKFIEFMNKFSESLHSKQIDGVSFDDLNSKSTKDKNVVIRKLNHLEKLMCEYLCLNNTELTDIDIFDFLKENVNLNITQDDADQYEEVLNDLTLNVDNSSKLLDEQNRASLVAIVAYSFDNDIDLDSWIVDYFERNNKYIRNQKENFIHMKQDLKKYIQKGKVA